MKESVSIIFKCDKEIYAIKRQNYLRVFPGYHAFPGGKVDKEDEDFQIPKKHRWQEIPSRLLGALIREVKEELGVDLLDLDIKGEIKSLKMWSKAKTPKFNPYRFCNFYFVVELKAKIKFTEDEGEIKESFWKDCSSYLKDFKKGELLCVPVFLDVLKKIDINYDLNEFLDLTPIHHEDDIPKLEPLFGIVQFLPLSHTFPPANRTNSYLIGDENMGAFLIDPSPIDSNELEKFYRSLSKYNIKGIFITHHHRDHYEFSNEMAKKLSLPIYISKSTLDRIKTKDDQNYFENIEIVLMKEGDVLTKWNNEDVSVFEVPGHDDGQLALAPKSMKWFLVGDLIQTIGTVVVGGEEGDMAKYFNSLNRVIDLKPNVLLPSHGIAIGGVNKLVETLNHRQMRENHIKELLESNHSEEDMLFIIYPDLEKRLHRYARKTIVAHINKIKGES